MVWFYISPEGDWKGHVGDVSLMSSMVKSLRSRGMEVRVQAGRSIHTFNLDLNTGMVLANAQKGEIDVNQLTVRFLMRDVSVILDKLDRCQLRDDIGVPYHKIHGRFNCLCLTPNQFQRFQKDMIEMESLGRAIDKAEHELLVAKLSGSDRVLINKREIPGVVEA